MAKTNSRDNLVCGILHISTKVSHGITKNGQIKKFTSHFPQNIKNFDLPIRTFYVKTKMDYQSTDVYVVIKVSDEILHKLPICTIDRYLGNIGDPNAEQLYLTTLCTLRWGNNKLFNINQINEFKDLRHERIDLTNLCNIYSIDPKGCIDIDDAIHVKTIEINDKETIYEIGIHISDVSSYVPENSDLDNELKIRGESVYLTNISTKKQIQINMLPPKLTEICSLTFGQKKRAFSIIILLKKTKNDPIFNILNIKFMKTLIVVTKNLSYEEAEIDEKITIMYDVGKHLYKQYVNSFEDNYDTHKMVEAYMILANVLSAEFLVNKNSDFALLRRHAGLKTINSSNTTSIIDEKYKELVSYSRNLMMTRAEYCIGFNENSRHVGLEKEYYTHFTSPIRRYADIIVHRHIFTQQKENYDINPLQYIIENLNKVHKIHDICERLSINLSKLFYIENKYGSVIYVIGKIVLIDHEHKKIRFIIKDEKITELNGLDIEKTIIERELEHLVDIKYDNNELTLSKKNYNIELCHIKLKLYDTIEVQISIVMKNKRKMYVQLMNPNINTLFNGDNDSYKSFCSSDDSYED